MLIPGCKGLELSLVVNFCPSWYRGEVHTLTTTTFRQIRVGQRVFLVSASSQLPSAQNNSYVKVPYFAVAYSAISLKLNNFLYGSPKIDSIIVKF